MTNTPTSAGDAFEGDGKIHISKRAIEFAKLFQNETKPVSENVPESPKKSSVNAITKRQMQRLLSQQKNVPEHP